MLMTVWPNVFWLCVAPVVAAVVWAVVVRLPGERRRWIFQPRPVWLLCWLRGELSLPVTLLTGGPMVAGMAWWVCATGYGPDGGWQWLMVAGWCGLLAVALLNAARKSHPEGLLCVVLVILVTLLLLGSLACLWRAVMDGLTGLAS
ncbi:hypothetical protein [Trabulsiella odontotermitis]|uniref:Uncharacterized protein n=1 Tax=Trabulsiella odontotermitis TaxID=379893 RepID=A0A0L0GVV4_9ENTR|nr:hypothetical protein [Trabulsiella odontotermitis]KNC93270.1 hypothetical protein GM31_20160 [Trabulsiella odontotermitis]